MTRTHSDAAHEAYTSLRARDDVDTRAWQALDWFEAGHTAAVAGGALEAFAEAPATLRREVQLQLVTGRLDLAIAHALTWTADNAPLSEVERQMVDHHVRDMRKVLEALSAPTFTELYELIEAAGITLEGPAEA